MRVAALNAGVSTQAWVGEALRRGLLATTVSEGSGSGKNERAEKKVAPAGNQRPGGVPAPVAAPSTAVQGSSLPFSSEDEELPWLGALGRQATKKDFEDPDFDPGEWQ